MQTLWWFDVSFPDVAGFYRTAWASQRISGRMLPFLTDEDLRTDLEISSGIHRKDILRTIGQLVGGQQGQGQEEAVEVGVEGQEGKQQPPLEASAVPVVVVPLAPAGVSAVCEEEV